MLPALHHDLHYLDLLSTCRHMDIDQDDGDHGVMPGTMEIMTVPWRWISKAQDDHGHIMSHILIACDVYLLYILFCLVRW